jgi:hypothetical protein
VLVDGRSDEGLMARSLEPIEPMTLANMRDNGVRSLLIWCRNSHHEKIMNVDHLPGNVIRFG